MQFINGTESLVVDAIDGLLRSSGGAKLARLDGYPGIKVVLRTDHKPGRVAIVAGVGLAGCATYDDEFATINSRLDQLDTKVQGAAQSAESANQSAQQANQRLDQMESRVRQLEEAPRRVPRG